MKNKFWLAIAALTVSTIVSCDKVDGPYKEENTINIGSLPGTLNDIRVLNATTTSDDVDVLVAKFSLESASPRTIALQFTWHGAQSNVISEVATGNDAIFDNDSVYITAPAPFGTLTFKYSATISDTLTGQADFVVPYTPTNPVKKVLLEDYTGRKCGNCPRAQRIIANTLEPLYHEQLVVATNHAGVYAVPDNPPSCFAEDFRNPNSDELNTFFGLSAYPSSMINRVGYPTTHIKYYNSWQSTISQELSKPNDAFINIYSAYNEGSRTAQLTISTEFLNNLGDDYKLAVFLIEDSIHGCQLDYDLTTPTQIDSAYIHRHVLRAALNSSFGENLINDPDLTTKYIRLYNYQIPDKYNVDQCYILAYVYQTNNYYVLQSELRKIKP